MGGQTAPSSQDFSAPAHFPGISLLVPCRTAGGLKAVPQREGCSGACLPELTPATVSWQPRQASAQEGQFRLAKFLQHPA